MEHAPILTLVVITLLQLCRAQSSSSAPEWYAANDINDTNFSPKPITELFSTETSFSPENPIIVLPPTSPTVSNRGVVSSPTPITQYDDPPNVIPLSTESPSSPPLSGYSRSPPRETQPPLTQRTNTILETTSTSPQPRTNESTSTLRTTQALSSLPSQTPTQYPQVDPQNVRQNQPPSTQNRLTPQMQPPNVQFMLPAQVGNRNFIPGQQFPPAMGQPNYIVLYQQAPQNIQNIPPVNAQVPQQFPTPLMKSRPSPPQIAARPPINNVIGNRPIMQRPQVSNQFFPQTNANVFPPLQTTSQQQNNQPPINQLPINQQNNQALNNQSPNQQPNNQQPPNNQFPIGQAPNNIPSNNQYPINQPASNIPSNNQPSNNLSPNNQYSTNQSPNNIPPNNQYPINQPPNNLPQNNQPANNPLPNNQYPIGQPPNFPPNNQFPSNQLPSNLPSNNQGANNIAPNNQYPINQSPNNLPPNNQPSSNPLPNNQYPIGQPPNLPPNNQFPIYQPPSNLQPNNQPANNVAPNIQYPVNQPNNFQPNNQTPNNVMALPPYTPNGITTRPRQKNRSNAGKLNNRGANRTQAPNMRPCQEQNSTIARPQTTTATKTQNPVITIRLTPSQGSSAVLQNKPIPTVRPTTVKPRQNSQVNSRNYERCLNSCRDKKDRICASPESDIQINPDTLKGFPSMCHMACHNTFRANPIYGKIANGRCGKLRTRIQSIDKTKIRRDELKKSQYTIISNVPGTVVELAQ